MLEAEGHKGIRFKRCFFVTLHCAWNAGFITFTGQVLWLKRKVKASNMGCVLLYADMVMLLKASCNNTLKQLNI